MKLILLVGILACIAVVSLLIVVALWRHKRAMSTALRVMDQVGVVSETLQPEGTVLVQGQLWRARSRDGKTIPNNSQVRVTRTEGHLLLVERCQGFGLEV